MTILPQPPAAPGTDARRLGGAALVEALRDSRRRTLAFVQSLSDEQWLPEYRVGVNPVAWELGHLGWFTEFWTQRGPHVIGEDGLVHATLPSTVFGPDAVFDSARLAHAARWNAALPQRPQLLSMLREQLEACIQTVPAAQDDALLYFHRLSLFHEDMHGEAFAWMSAALGYSAPHGYALVEQRAGEQQRFEGGALALCPTTEAHGFLFDNELRQVPATVQPFDIDSRCVTAGQFLEFVEAGGYDRPEYWPGDAGAWRVNSTRSHPARWRQVGTAWQARWFDQWEALNPRLPAIHVNAFEAQAYCAWLGRRLPSAVEWEYAASYAPSERFDWGKSVWEWTRDAFAPYPGFCAGPYRDYSLPWFGDHRELRGGAFTTHTRMHHPQYRNFFQPHRTDIFAGFRTAASL